MPYDEPTALLWSTGVLVAASGSVDSGWVDVSAIDEIVIGKTSAGGVYVFEIDWSRDGATVDFTEVVSVADKTSVTKDVAGLWALFRVRNTDAVAAFTAHRTNVFRGRR